MLDEAENAGEFLLALRDALAAQSERFEIVVVNDGSRDATRDVVLAAAAACRVRYIELSRNFGKEAALSAGLAAARGDVVLTLDGDFQHPLAELPAMLARWREGYEMVYGVRDGRRDEGLAKRLGTAVFYGLLTRGSAVKIPPGAGDFRLMDRKVVDALLRLPERSRFMKGLYGWVGFRSIPFTYRVEPRAHGRSSFTMHRLVASSSRRRASSSSRSARSSPQRRGARSTCAIAGDRTGSATPIPAAHSSSSERFSRMAAPDRRAMARNMASADESRTAVPKYQPSIVTIGPCSRPSR